MSRDPAAPKSEQTAPEPVTPEPAAPKPADRTDRERWRAVVTRERSPRAAFFYAVETTGVYCRPGCPSRLPKRDHVRFYDTPADAERAGFRPCKRCAPRRPARPDPGRDAVVRACRHIESAATPPTLKELADHVGLSPHHLQRLFRAAVGVTPREYAAGRRVSRLQERLGAGAPVTEALYDAGFGSSSRLYEGAEAMLGMEPSRYRRGGPGAEIRYAVRPCSLGWVLVAATQRGVCAIALGDAPEPLEDAFRRRFPHAALTGDDPNFAGWVSRVIEEVEAPGGSPDLPLDVRGTAFQRRVWRALAEIPPGTTTTYGELAGRLGRPTAARAVARACASNPVAVVIPCHRVVAATGALTGYRWGVERKRALLERERDRSGPHAPDKGTPRRS